MKRRSLVFAAACFVFAGVTHSTARTWVQANLGVNDWIAVASSANGSNLFALAVRGLVVSTNAGQTWTTNSMPLIPWIGLACSADGSKLLTASSLGPLPQYRLVLTSSDFGTTWTTNVVPNLIEGSESLSALACSADGNTLVVVGSYGQIYLSTNGGSAWEISTNASFGWFSGVACSPSGKKIAVMWQAYSGGPGGVMLSTNSGQTWHTSTPLSLTWTAVGFSDEGEKLFACGRNLSPATGLYVTENDGASWTQSTLPHSMIKSMTISADSKKVALASSRIFTSVEGGMNWNTNSIPNATAGWLIAGSADGANLIAVPDGIGFLHITQVPQVPRINLARVQDKSHLSWIVPASDFALETTASLTQPDWQTVTNFPQLNLSNLHHEVILPSSLGNQFFRLQSE